MIGTDPTNEMPLLLKQRRPFALLLEVQKADGTPADIAGAVIRMVVADTKRKGSAVKFEAQAITVDEAAALARFDVQAAQLDLPATTYLMAVTLTTSDGYAVSLVEGEVEVTYNPDTGIPPAYDPDTVPALSLTARLLKQSKVTVRVNHLPDRALQAALSTAQAAASTAEEAQGAVAGNATAAQQSAVSAASSALAAIQAEATAVAAAESVAIEIETAANQAAQAAVASVVVEAADQAAAELWGDFDTSVTTVDANPASALRVQQDTRLSATIAGAQEPLQDELDLIPATYQLRPTGSGFVAFGDSISTAELSSAGGAGYGGAWPHMACALSEQRLNFRGNAGVTGNTSTQIRARITDAIALAPSVVTILAGANNITASGSDGAPAFATFKDDIRAICNTLRAAGIRVALCTILPRGGAMHTTTRLATTMKWNAWLREYARNGAEFPQDRGGFEIVDFFDLVADPATGQFKSGYDSGDGLHPSQACHMAMAALVVSRIQTYAYKPIAATINTGDPYNLLANPLLAVGAPTSWITSGSATADWTEGLVTDADFKGKAWEVAFTSTASESNFREFKSFVVSTGFTPGDKVLMSLRTKITVASGTAIVPSTTAGVRARLLTAGGTPAVITPLAGLSAPHASALHWFRFTVPTGTTSLQVSSLVGAIPVGSNFTVRVGEFGLFNLTAMGLA